MLEMMRIGVDMMTGERRSDLKVTDDRKVIQNSSGLLPKIIGKETIPSSAEEVVPDHIEIVVDSEANRKIEKNRHSLAEKSRQRDQRVICSRKLRLWRKKLELLRQAIRI